MMANIWYRSDADKGASLIEILIILTIIGILLTIALPSIKSLGNGIMLNATAIQLVEDLRYTQQMSLYSKGNYMLRIDTRNNSYVIRPKDGDSFTPSLKTVYLSDGIFFKSHNLAKYNQASYRYYIEFNSVTGIPGQAGYIELADADNNQIKIIIAVSTGRVRLEKNE
ncbi:MAG: hypothetical protein GX974_05335 [Clostridiales bacterium]|nr:hypothetical protein [Clostridiales bacterium]